MTTSVDERVRYLLRAALRAEDEGDRRVARSLRRMAEEACPVRTGSPLSWLEPVGMERCAE